MGARRLLSRVADSIYWMARYVERAENAARSIEVNLNLMLDQSVGAKEQWEPLVAITGDLENFEKLYGEARPRSVLRFLTFDEANSNSILNDLRRARENARSVRDTITSEMWEQINKAYLMVESEAVSGRALMQPTGFFEEVRLASQLFDGVTRATLSYGEGFHFYRLGRMIERSDQTTRLLDMKYFILLPSVRHVGTPLDDIQWAAVLKSASAFEMYRQQHGQLDPKRIIEFLLLDRDFPRSVHHCIIRAEDSLHRITGSAAGTFGGPAEQKLGQLNAEMNFTGVEDVIRVGMHEYLDQTQGKLIAVDRAIFDTFFAPHPMVAAATMRQSQGF